MAQKPSTEPSARAKPVPSPEAHLGPGRVAVEAPRTSAILGGSRFVRVYLPGSYDLQPERRYPVLYIQDGQNAYSTAGEHVAYGWGSWQLDKTVDRLAAERAMQEIIMVAVDCSSRRYLEYRGPAYQYHPRTLARLKRPLPSPGDNSQFEAYSRFLSEELKPAIDSEYRTLPGPNTTGLLGSSLGGIFSLALAWQAPDTFGLAASFSGAFQVERRYFLLKVLRAYGGPVKSIRVYLDSGITDYGGGDDGRKHTAAVAHELRRIGWRDGVNLLHFVDSELLDDSRLQAAGLPNAKWAEAKTSQHNEFYWRIRAGRALQFLFPTQPRSLVNSAGQ